MNIRQLWRNQATLGLRKLPRRKAFDGVDTFYAHRSQELFGVDPDEGVVMEIYCFTIGHYVYFLDHVSSLDDLIEGLFQLSPFVDDAFAVAKSMSEADFIEFKLALVSERKASRGEGESRMPEKYYNLLLPNRFPMAILLSEKAKVSLGPALLRIIETEIET